MYRLVVIGGEYDRYTSNEVRAEIPDNKTEFTGYFLDESIFVTGVMIPWVGRGLEASFTAVQQNYPEDNISYIDEYKTYQWYRVNPVSYEMTAIEGATELKYVTTEDDVGYYLMIRATGDNENISGFAQVMSKNGVVVQNDAYVKNATSTGFTLNLYKAVPGLTVDDLELVDYYGEPVKIKSVSQGANAAIYNISADLELEKGPYKLSNNSYFWRITSEGYEQHVFEGVQVPYSVDRYEVNVAYVEGVVLDIIPGYEAVEGDIVTIKIDYIIEGKQFDSITVVDGDDEEVIITEVKEGEEYTFVMPAKSVTVKVDIVNE